MAKTIIWYYALNNQRHGPVSESEFDFLVHQGKILPGTLVWNEGMTDWRPWREVMPSVEPQSPPPPPPEFLRGSDQYVPSPSDRNGPEWEDRDRVGAIRATVGTLRELLQNPGMAFARMKREGDWIGPFCFALFIGMLGLYANLAYGLVVIRFDSAALTGMEALLASNAGALFMIISAYFSFPLVIAALVIFNSVLIHFSLVLLGKANQPFQTTYRVVCYSLGASSLLQFVPVLGFVLTLSWNLFSLVAGIARTHEISKGTAILALTPVILYTAYFLTVAGGIF